jgi:hypothetical protein
LRRGLALALASCAIGGAVGCAASSKREALALLAAMERYQRADNAEKAAQADGVAAVDCSDPRVCDAKRACLAAVGPTAQALALKDEVAARVDDLQAKRLPPESPEAQALPGKLDLASRLLTEGRAKMPDCEKKLADLRLSIGS